MVVRCRLVDQQGTAGDCGACVQAWAVTSLSPRRLPSRTTLPPKNSGLSWAIPPVRRSRCKPSSARRATQPPWSNHDDSASRLHAVRADTMVAGRPSPVRRRAGAGCRCVACRRSDGWPDAEHRWGLAAKGFAAKGGWGPGLGDDYLVRQFGIVPTASGTVGVALAAEVHDGEYEAGVDVVNSAGRLGRR